MPSASSPADLHIANDLPLAAGDVRDAKDLLRTKSRNAAYLAEQAIEKLLLALLTSEDVHVPRQESHRLDILVDKLPAKHPMLDRLKALTFLTIYATTYRYTKTGGRLPPLPNWEKITDAINRIDALIVEACAHFGVDLSAGDHVPARNITQMRDDGDGAGGGASGGALMARSSPIEARDAHRVTPSYARLGLSKPQ